MSEWGLIPLVLVLSFLFWGWVYIDTGFGRLDDNALFFFRFGEGKRCAIGDWIVLWNYDE